MFEDHPAALTPNYEMSEPNENIVIEEGEYTLYGGKIPINVQGVIEKSWFPNQLVRFKCSHKPTHPEEMVSMFSKSYQIDYNGEKTQLEIISSNLEIIDDETTFVLKAKIKDNLPNYLIPPSLKEKTTIQFQLANSPRLGKDFIQEKDKAVRSARSYLYSIYGTLIIDDKVNHYERFQLLRGKGGIITTHNCEVTLIKDLNEDDFIDFINCLRLFFSFIAGSFTSPLLFNFYSIKGENRSYFINPLIDPYRIRLSIHTASLSVTLESFYTNFEQKWMNNSKEKELFKDVIFWYCEANNKTPYCDGSIILAHTALETIFNIWIVQILGIIRADDAKNMQASNKIRLIVNQVGLKSSIPERFAETQNGVEKYNRDKDIYKQIDGPFCVSETRNRIVHAGSSNNNKLKFLKDSTVLREVLDLSLYYIEISLLTIIGFKGDFFDRSKMEDQPFPLRDEPN